LSVRDDDQIMLLTARGQSVRCPVADIRVVGRATQGVKLVDLAEGDRLLALARVVEVKDDEVEDAGEPPNIPPEA
jgi:DNA gyrase subunit A